MGCTANDLKSHVLECPASKLGQIIGKGGSNIKKLESKTGCLIDLDKVKSQIHLQGNESSIELAVKEIENITLAIEEEMKLDHAVFHFLFSKVSIFMQKMYIFVCIYIRVHVYTHYDTTCI